MGIQTTLGLGTNNWGYHEYAIKDPLRPIVIIGQYRLADTHKHFYEEERVHQLENLIWIMFNYLPDGSTVPPYIILNTAQQSESNTWKSNRWFRITASTLKVAYNLGNILNIEHQFCDATKYKLFNFISYLDFQTFCILDPVYMVLKVTSKPGF